MNLRYVLFVGFYVALHVPLFLVLLVLWPYTVLFDRRRRGLMYRVFWAYNRTVARLFWRVDVEGMPMDSAPPTAVYILNHQTLWDHIMCYELGKVHPRTIAKSEISRIPLVGTTLMLLDEIFVYKGNPRANAAVMDRCVGFLREGISICLFPEGTRWWLSNSRTPDGRRMGVNELAEFKIGAFKIACEAGVPIVPVVFEMRHIISDVPRMEAHPGTYFARILEPVQSGGKTPEELRDECFKLMSAAMPLVTSKAQWIPDDGAAGGSKQTKREKTKDF